MIQFKDGPAVGVILQLERAPMFLRVVHSGAIGRGPKGEPLGDWDALDQLEDLPKPEERVWVYEIVGTPGFCHVDGRDPKTGKRFGRTSPTAAYRLFHQQPSNDVVRDNVKWGEWATKTGTAIRELATKTGFEAL